MWNEPRLRRGWHSRGAGTWQSTAGGIVLTVCEYSDDARAFWRVAVAGLDGTADSLFAAQLAAEYEAFQWLSEGVAAMGGRVLTGDEVALVVDALRAHGEYLSDEWAKGPELLRGAAMLALARKMEAK